MQVIGLSVQTQLGVFGMTLFWRHIEERFCQIMPLSSPPPPLTHTHTHTHKLTKIHAHKHIAEDILVACGRFSLFGGLQSASC